MAAFVSGLFSTWMLNVGEIWVVVVRWGGLLFGLELLEARREAGNRGRIVDLKEE